MYVSRASYWAASMGKQASVKSGPPEMQDDADNRAHQRVRCLPASSTVSRGLPCRYTEEKGSSLQAHGQAGSPQARRQRPSPDDANRVVVQVEQPASSNQASTHARTVSRSRRQCTGAPAAGCARHSPQARRQHASPDLADLVVTQHEGPARSNITHTHTVSRSRRQCTGATAAGCARHSRHAWRQHAGPDPADLVVTQIEGPAGTHTHTVSRSRRQCTGARHSRHARRQLTRADARPVSSSQHALATHGTRE